MTEVASAVEMYNGEAINIIRDTSRVQEGINKKFSDDIQRLHHHVLNAPATAQASRQARADPLQEPGGDAWATWNRGNHGRPAANAFEAHGQPSHFGPQATPQFAPRQVPGGSEQSPYGKSLGMSHGWSTPDGKPGGRLFDKKMATLPEYQYNGATGGDIWRTKVRNYFVGRCPDVWPLLNWVESLGETPRSHELADAAIRDYGMMLDGDPRVPSAAIW